MDRGSRRTPKSLSWSFFALAVAVLIGGGSAARADLSQDTLKALIPADGAAAGWVRDGELQEFAGEDLYTYIDGGAEIYQEYGFRRVVIQDYKNTADKSISLEIFEMAAPDAAYGMYTFKRSGSGKALSLGSEGELEDYYLNFWKGRYLVTVTGFDESPETLAGVVAVAEAADSRMTGSTAPPSLIAALPERGLRSGSIKYLKGLLGLNNVYSFYSARGLDFREAVKGDYEDGTILIVLDYGSADAREKAWEELFHDHLSQTDRFKGRGPGPGGEPVFEDGKGRTVIFGLSGSFLVAGINDSPDAALDKVRQALRRPPAKP